MKHTKTIERVLTRSAQKTARVYEQRYGSLKTALSAGIMALDLLSPADREKALALASGEKAEKKVRG